MTGTRPPDPALHFPASDFISTAAMAQKQIDSGMYHNAVTFPNIPTDVAVFTPALALLIKYIGKAKGNSAIVKLRDAQSVVVHGYLAVNLLYAKIVCHHDPALIVLSAYDSTHAAEQDSAPETAGTVKVVKGKESGTWRAILERKKTKTLVTPSPKTHQSRVRYTIQITVTPSDPNSWKTIAEGCSFYKLIFKASDVTALKKNYIRIYGVNAAGAGQPNNPFPFSPEID